MDPKSFRVSQDAITQAIQTESKDFTFVVGSTEYKCCRFQACMFSKRICRIVLTDRSFDTFTIPADGSEKTFNDIMKLMDGQAIEVTSANAPVLAAWARELENDQLLQVAGSFTAFNSPDLADVIALKKKLNQDISGEIAHVASHFNDFDLEFFERLPIDDIEAVLCSDSLHLETEDGLFTLIQSLAISDPSYTPLLRFVHFQNLTEQNLALYLDLVFPELMTQSLWEAISQALLAKAKPAEPVDPTFSPEQGQFNGIIQYLRNKCGGNPHEKGVIRICASSSGRYGVNPWQIVDYGWGGWWHTNCVPGQWVQVDFVDRRINVTEYTIMSDGNTGDHLLKWVIEVSEDGETWREIDSQDTQDLNANFAVKTFRCAKPTDEFARYVRLRQTGRDSLNLDFLMIGQIEFFGTLKEN